MVRILITRHGQTKKNVERIVQGNKDGEITEKGYIQIKKLIKRLKNEKIEKIISSDTLRCKITTNEIIKEIPLPVEYTSLIREKYNGDFVGKSHKELKWEDLPGTFETKKAPNGENLKEVRDRGIKFFEEIKKKYANSEDSILMISHGAFTKAFVGNLLGMNLQDSMFKLFIEHCSLTELEINKNHKKGYRFNFINDTSHLDI